MIGLDTNVLVRYVTQDDPKQSVKAAELVESLTSDSPGFVSVVCLVEFAWVLDSCYELGRDQVAGAIEGVLRSRELVVERAEQVVSALRAFRRGSADFADCVIECSGAHAGCDRTMTFDVAAARSARMTLIA